MGPHQRVICFLVLWYFGIRVIWVYEYVHVNVCVCAYMYMFICVRACIYIDIDIQEKAMCPRTCSIWHFVWNIHILKKKRISDFFFFTRMSDFGECGTNVRMWDFVWNRFYIHIYKNLTFVQICIYKYTWICTCLHTQIYLCLCVCIYSYEIHCIKCTYMHRSGYEKEQYTHTNTYTSHVMQTCTHKKRFDTNMNTKILFIRAHTPRYITYSTHMCVTCAWVTLTRTYACVCACVCAHL